jgi:hypothetical protein
MDSDQGGTTMSDNPDPIKEMIEKRNAAIEADAALRRSPDYIAALKRAETLAYDYTIGLNAVSLMSTRSPIFGKTRLSLRVLDLLLESTVSILGLIRDGLLNPARREMRFLFEASIKAWWCDSVDRDGVVESKIDFLDDLGAVRFREVAETLRPRLLEEPLREQLLQTFTNLYAGLSTHVHASTGGIGVNVRRFSKGKYIGFETAADVHRLNGLFAQVLDISLASVFESFDAGLLGDIFVQVFDKNSKWAFHRTPLVKSISAYYDYKAERQHQS